MRTDLLTHSALATLLLLGVVACGGGGGGSQSAVVPDAPVSAPTPAAPAVDTCGVENQKAFVLETAQDWYLWYDEMAAVDPEDYATANEYLRALTAPLAVGGRDPGFSYVTTRAEDEATFSSGAFVGFGFRFQLDGANRFFFSDVFEGSPTGDAGLARGTEVLAIDTGEGFESMASFVARDANLNELFGARETGVERGFRLRVGDEVSEVTLQKRELETPPLAGQPLLIPRLGLPPVGYLNMRGFTATASAPLDAAFERFRSAGVTEVVLDLRYNGGGLLDVADRLLDLLGGRIARGQDSFRVRHNDKRSDNDLISRFIPDTQTIEPLKVAFITTGATASASELIINSLAPWVELALIGSDTLGKAVGQYGFDQENCDTRMRLVAFELVNSDGQGGFYNGLGATGRFTLCPALDDVSRPFGDPAEASLAVALDWLNTSACTTGGISARAAQQTPSDWGVANQPQWIDDRSPWVQ